MYFVVVVHFSENVWNLTRLPKSMAVLGTGAIGSELSQCFARYTVIISLSFLMERFGTKVTILARSRILSKEDPEASALVEYIRYFELFFSYTLGSSLSRMVRISGLTLVSRKRNMTIPRVYDSALSILFRLIISDVDSQSGC